jgi:hypothetical protein
MNRLRHHLSDAKTVLYRNPRDQWARLRRWGPRAYFRCDAWAREMEAAAWQLPILPSSVSPLTSLCTPLSIWFLTGRRFWYQTAFCAWTLAKQSCRDLSLNLVDDGTLEARHVEGLRRLFPAGVTLRKDDVRARLDELLPLARFPVLRQRWLDYVNIRKLIDIHLGSTGVKLVLDSDMLFFRRPDALLAWWDGSQGISVREDNSEIKSQTLVPGIQTSDLQPSASPLTTQVSGFSPHPSDPPFSPCLMTDCVESYGYSRSLMEKLAGAPIPPLLNVGICGLQSETLYWEELECWCRILVEREGTSYFLEQALVAMIAARSVPVVMPQQDFITFPNKKQTLHGCGVLQHYVADSKPWYFGHAWKFATTKIE